MTVYQEIFEVIKERKKQYENGTAAENSYTCYLFDKGVDKICKKVGEEATETVIAAKNGDNNELMNEINDLCVSPCPSAMIPGPNGISVPSRPAIGASLDIRLVATSFLS